MPIYHILETAPSVQELAVRTASLLGTSRFLNSIRKASDKKKTSDNDDGLDMFCYEWGDEFKRLADEITKNHVCTRFSKT
jgi:hypothetical protein